MNGDPPCPAADVQGELYGLPSSPNEPAHGALPPHYTVMPNESVQILIRTATRQAMALEQLAESISELVEGIRDLLDRDGPSAEEPEIPTVGLDGKPIPRS